MATETTTDKAFAVKLDTEIAETSETYSNLCFKIKQERRTMAAKYVTDAVKIKASAAYDKFRAELVETGKVLDALNAQYTGWERYWLVTNVGGHIHFTTDCSTCFPTTQFAWLTEHSGTPRAELVEIAGERACTVCFPGAPVDVTKRPSMLKYDVEAREAKAARDAEKQAKTTKAAAERVVVGQTVYKTLRAAENALSWELESVVGRTYMEARDAEHRAHLENLVAEDRGAVEAIADAIQTVYPDWDRAGVLAKKFDAKVKVYRKAGYDIPADATY